MKFNEHNVNIEDTFEYKMSGDEVEVIAVHSVGVAIREKGTGNYAIFDWYQFNESLRKPTPPSLEFTVNATITFTWSERNGLEVTDSYHQGIESIESEDEYGVEYHSLHAVIPELANDVEAEVNDVIANI